MQGLLCNNDNFIVLDAPFCKEKRAQDFSTSPRCSWAELWSRCSSCCRRQGKSPHQLRSFSFPAVGALKGTNVVITSKYTLLTFVPKLLFALFRKKAYLYFLFLAVLVFIPVISPVQPYGPVAALCFLVAISAVREGVQDVKRHREDAEVNSSLCNRLRNGAYENARWCDLVVGDVIRLESGELVPADLAVLKASPNAQLCYVSTLGLDGETNAKVKRVPVLASRVSDELSGVIQSEEPSKDLSRFVGTLTIGSETVALENENVIYRGSRLVQTESMIGVVIFTGQETKIMQNIGGQSEIRFKVTSLERRLDQFIVVMFAMLLVMCVASAVANGALQSQALTFAYLQPFDRSPAVSGVISFFTYLILYSGIVPLPLYVSLEAVKVAQAVLIGWDVDMCSDGLATKARSSLSDELGRVDTLFTDKTGTLTRNEMVFRRFCLRDGVVRSLDELQGSQEENGEAELWRALALCHSASLGVDGTWHGESPDEIALLKGLAKVRPQRAFSIEEQDKEGGRVIVLASGEKYKLLDTVVFSSERKMMSVLVQRESDGAEIVYTKGAEQAVMQCCSLQEDAVNSVTCGVTELARDGLRTLAVARRQLQPGESDAWRERARIAASALHDREARRASLAAGLERGLVLLGATGVEDRLQDSVPEVVRDIMLAGIRVWMITGDRSDTALNVAASCNLFRPDKDSLCALLGAESTEDVNHMLGSFLPSGESVVAVDGVTLGYILQSSVSSARFLQVCGAARAVICSRVTPKQKGEIVCLVRSQLRVVTCAIGDGSNDVPMLRVADVSVGLFGKEGRQAVMAADYATGQFRFLRTLLFFHGRESYHRVVLLLLYSFYKGVAFAFLSQWFSIFSLFSGQTLFESWHLAMFHVLFTSVPMIIFAVTDFEVPNKEVALQNPKLYGRDLFSLPLFLSWLLRGLYDSVVVFFVCMAAFGDDSAGALGYGLFSFGIVILTASVLLVNARLALYVTHFTLVMAGAFLLTLILFFGFLVLLSVTSNTGKDQSMYFVSLNVMGLPTFWLSVMLCIVVGLMPDWIWLVFRDQPDTVILNRMEAKK